MTAVFDSSQLVETSSSFELGGVCYYEVTPAEGDSQDIHINFQALSITNTIITLSSGTSPKEIDTEIEVSTSNGYAQNMTANNTLWITVLAYGEDPEAIFRIQLVKEPEPEVVVIPEKIRPTLEANEKLPGEVPPSDYQPQLAIYVVMFCTMAGIFGYLVLDSCLNRCQQRKQSLAIGTTHLTDRELMSLDEQMKMLEEESSKIEQVQKINRADLNEPSQSEGWAAKVSSRGGAAASHQGSHKSKIVQSESAGPEKKGPGEYERKKTGMTKEQVEEVRKQNAANATSKRRRVS